MGDAQAATNYARLWAFLRRELRPQLGRTAAVVRVAVCCTLVVIVWMIFQIPECAYAVYIVFLVSGSDAGVSLKTAIAGLLAATFGIGLSIIFYSFDAAEPALRLPMMALSTFLGMFLSRTIALGPVAFLLGFLLVITQTLVDIMPSTETLTRLLLWLWLVAAGPALFTALVQLWLGPHPDRLLRSTVTMLLTTMAEHLRGPTGAKLDADSWSSGTLLELRERAAMVDKRFRGTAQIDTEIIETLDALSKVASAIPPNLPAAARRPLEAACITCRDAVAHDAPPAESSPWPSAEVLEALDSASRPIVIALAVIVERLTAVLVKRQATMAQQTAKHPETAERTGFFVPDAFSNPEHFRFAFKATLAAMSTYILYTGMDWPGIRTGMITCFFVALNTTGETVHKLSLRLTGVVIGGLLGELCIVFALPHMTDIGDLALMVTAAAALCAWVSASSGLLAYAGMQMALAFFLGTLQGYGPTTDLTVVRDRLVGIILGNVVMSIVFSVAWPVSTTAQARKALAGALLAVVRLLRETAPAPSAGAQLSVTRSIEQARRLVSMSGFEAPLLPAQASSSSMRMRESISAFEEVARAAFVVADQLPAGRRAAQNEESQMIADWLAECARRWTSEGPLKAPFIARDKSALSPKTDLGTLTLPERSALEAQSLLCESVAGFATHVA